MKARLKQVHRLILWYALGFSPVTLVYIVWFTKHPDLPIPETGLFAALNWFSLGWILSLIYIIGGLLFHGGFRESVIARLAGFREGDEREQLVTAGAARGTFLFMLAVQITLLIMSVTTVGLVLQPPDGKPGKHGTLTIGFKASAENLELYALPPRAPAHPQALFEFGGNLIPPNMTLPLLLLVLLQLGAFRLFSRRRYEGMDA